MKIKFTEDDIKRELYRWRNLTGYICIPNVIMKPTMYEADMIMIREESRFLQEFEIKTSIEDFRCDFKKRHYHDSPQVSMLYYVMPECVIKKNKDEIMQSIGDAGLISVGEYCIGGKTLPSIPQIIKKGVKRKGVEPLDIYEYCRYLRLGCLKIYRY